MIKQIKCALTRHHWELQTQIPAEKDDHFYYFYECQICYKLDKQTVRHLDTYDDIDENAPEVTAGNIVNEVLLAHKGFWEKDAQSMINEVQDMVAAGFVEGMRWGQARNDVPPKEET